jgi:peptidyl-tRNA hydrolase
MEEKMIFLVRKDIKMDPGKVAVQVAHAAGKIIQNLYDCDFLVRVKLDENIQYQNYSSSFSTSDLVFLRM